MKAYGMEQYRNVPVGSLVIGEAEKQAIMAVLDSGRISEGEQVQAFQNAFATFIGSQRCILTNSGTSALIAALTALKGDERFPKARNGASVLVSPVTYAATLNALILSGFEPVFADIDPVTFKLDIEQVRRRCEEDRELAGLLPVHLMGYPNDMDAMLDLADRYDLFVLEDASQAHGTLYGGRRLGSFGTMGAFSFFVAHNIQAGELGCITTNDTDLAQQLIRIKANGRRCDCALCTRHEGHCPHMPDDDPDAPDPRFLHDIVGYNFKAMEFQAALGLVQLPRVEEIFQARQAKVAYLNKALAPLESDLVLPVFSEDVSYLAYPLVVRPESRLTRNGLTRALTRVGVETRPLFGCLPTQQPAFARFQQAWQGRLPEAERIGRDGFYIGCHPNLDEEDLAYVASVFKRIVSNS